MNGRIRRNGLTIDDGRRRTDDGGNPQPTILCPPSSVGRILTAVLWLLLVAAAPARGVEVGEPVPRFILPTIEGPTVSWKDLEGEPALLVFWNTWCPNCMRELPKINRLAEEFTPRGMRFFAINTAINDSEGKARAYWEKSGYVFPTGYDYSFEVGQAFRVRGVPTIFLVDSRGIVRFKQARLPGDGRDTLRQLFR